MATDGGFGFELATDRGTTWIAEQLAKSVFIQLDTGNPGRFALGHAGDRR